MSSQVNLNDLLHLIFSCLIQADIFLLLTRCCMNKCIRKYEITIVDFYGLETEDAICYCWVQHYSGLDSGLDIFTAEERLFLLSVVSCHHDQDTWKASQWHNTEDPYPSPTSLRQHHYFIYLISLWTIIDLLQVPFSFHCFHSFLPS